MNLPERFEKTLQSQKLIFPGDKVFVACSGGPDSVGLFYLLRGLQKKWDLRLGLLHLNHALRGRKSDWDERSVRNLARQFSVPIYSQKKLFFKKAKEDGESLEEAARKARYDFFIQTAKRRRIPKIATAHTQDDQAETVLMRILQGTGLRGLSGIRPQLKKGGITFIRPLLGFPKREILEFLRAQRIPFCSDRSNRSYRFFRNRIRMKLLPWLEREFNPRLIPTLARIPAIVTEENELLKDLEEAAWKRTLRRRWHDNLYLDAKAFLKFPSPLQFRILNCALRKLDPRSGVGFDAWQKLRGHLGRNRFRYSFPRDIDLSLTPSKMVIYKKFSAGKPR
jgi:tRNA(Ile)-lysidine synthase